MKISKAKLRQIIKEELGTSRKPDWSALDQAFSSYLVEYIKAAELAQGEEELNDLWDHTTAQLRDLTDAESFRAHGRMSAGSTASRKPRKLGEEIVEGRAKQAHDLTKGESPKALLKAAASLIMDPMTTVTIRKFVFDLVKGLDDEDFNDFEEALATAADPWGERPRVTSTGPWAPEKL